MDLVARVTESKVGVRMPVSRRALLQAGVAACAASAAASPLLASIFQAAAAKTGNRDALTTRLDAGWEYDRGPLDAPWEIWHSEEIATWQPVALPHGFNHYDACDPDTSDYRGPELVPQAHPYRKPFSARTYGAAL
jgi:beta-galactosidase